jgi:hypothetical protein
MIEYNLTQEQKELLKIIVDAYDAGDRGEFFFLQTHGGDTLAFHNHPNESVTADLSDFQQLAKEDLISLEHRRQTWVGKPKAKGIAYAHELFRDPHDTKGTWIWSAKQPAGYTDKRISGLSQPTVLLPKTPVTETSQETTAQITSDFEVYFAPNFSPDEVKDILTALADYYRKCGGAGFELDLEPQEATVKEPVHV